MKDTHKIKGAIFDLDGVICSTDEFHFEAWQQIARKIGITNFTRSDNNRQRGVSRMDSLEVLLEKVDRDFSYDEKLALAEEKNAIYIELLKNMSIFDLSDEVKLTLSTLRKKGILLAIGSSSKNTKLILTRIGLDNFFDAVADGNCITKSKPDPEVFLKAAEMIHLEPKVCLVIEDAPAGIKAGHDGGFETAGIGEAMNDRLTTYPIKSISQILDIIK